MGESNLLLRKRHELLFFCRQNSLSSCSNLNEWTDQSESIFRYVVSRLEETTQKLTSSVRNFWRHSHVKFSSQNQSFVTFQYPTRTNRKWHLAISRLKPFLRCYFDFDFNFRRTWVHLELRQENFLRFNLRICWCSKQEVCTYANVWSSCWVEKFHFQMNFWLTRLSFQCCCEWKF